MASLLSPNTSLVVACVVIWRLQYRYDFGIHPITFLCILIRLDQSPLPTEAERSSVF